MVRDRGDGVVRYTLCDVEQPRLQVCIAPRRGSAWIVPFSFAGTLCLETTMQTQHIIDHWMVEQDVTAVDVDLSAVDFIDARGVSLLLRMRTRCDENRHRLGRSTDLPLMSVSAASACALRLFGICEIEAILGVGSLHDFAV